MTPGNRLEHSAAVPIPAVVVLADKSEMCSCLFVLDKGVFICIRRGDPID